jgi:chitin synthase
MEILTTSLADPSFGLNGIKYFNIVVKYYYIALLRASIFPSTLSSEADERNLLGVVCCFILALGNRPAGSHGFYLVIMVSFALITTYMLVRRFFPRSSFPFLP